MPKMHAYIMMHESFWHRLLYSEENVVTRLDGNAIKFSVEPPGYKVHSRPSELFFTQVNHLICTNCRNKFTHKMRGFWMFFTLEPSSLWASRGTSVCFISQMFGKLNFRKGVNSIICQIAPFTFFPN